MGSSVAFRAVAVGAVFAVALTGCSGAGKPGRGSDGGHGSSPATEGFYLASSFEQPVCGNYHHPGVGCEFGIQGQVQTGKFGCRTGSSCLEEQRGGTTHFGALRNVPVSGGTAFVGCAFKVPQLVPAQKPFVELMQLSPGDGSQPLNPIEVRIYTSTRQLSLGQFKGPAEPATSWTAPVDQWFYVVVHMRYGTAVPNSMWVYGPDDRLAAAMTVDLTTAGGRGKDKPRQKIGGVTNELSAVTSYADDWYIANQDWGPLHIDASGAPVAGSKPSSPPAIPPGGIGEATALPPGADRASSPTSSP
jgi:hypothetical protein